MCKFIVNTKEILANFTRAKSYLKPKTKVCVVVKANAYGFGLTKICSLFNSLADYFAVARLSEFLKVREVSKKPCLILSPLSDKENIVAVKSGAEITITPSTNINIIEKAAKSGQTLAKVHIKLDTGMNRYGFKNENDLRALLEQLKKLSHIKVVGVFSHLLYAEDKKTTEMQRERFISYKKLILSYGFKPIFHLANSEGLKDKANQFDMVRLGLGLYLGNEHKFVTYITEIKSVSKGETISYNGNFKAVRDMKIAICGAGYGDGVNRLLSQRGEVLINGHAAKIVGNVCMDCFMADVSKIRDVKLFDEVVIFGKSGEKYISVCELANLCDTIPYEILTNISLRVKRIYKWRNYAGYSREVWREKTP